MEQKNGRAELLLAGLKMRIQDAPSETLHKERAVLDREELLRLVDNITEVVKNELKMYREVTDKRATILREAQEEAEEILYQAEKTASRIRVTKRRDDEPPAFKASELSSDEKQMLRTASDIYAASLIYTDEMLTEVDHLVQESYDRIEQEYSRMKSTLRQKVEDISENKAELMSNLNSLKANDRYAQILELSDLLSVELYKERMKAIAKEREERGQLSFELSDEGKKEVLAPTDRPQINPDRTAKKIDQKKETIEIEVMDRSDEAVSRKRPMDE